MDDLMLSECGCSYLSVSKAVGDGMLRGHHGRLGCHWGWSACFLARRILAYCPRHFGLLIDYFILLLLVDMCYCFGITQVAQALIVLPSRISNLSQCLHVLREKPFSIVSR